MCKMWTGSSLLIAGVCKIQTGVQEQGPKFHDKPLCDYLCLCISCVLLTACPGNLTPAQVHWRILTMSRVMVAMCASCVLSLFSTIFRPFMRLFVLTSPPGHSPALSHEVHWEWGGPGAKSHDMMINVGSLVMKLACITLKKKTVMWWSLQIGYSCNKKRGTTAWEYLVMSYSLCNL